MMAGDAGSQCQCAAARTLHALKSSWDRGLFCDTSLIGSDDNCVQMHKVLLVSVSKYAQTLSCPADLDKLHFPAVSSKVIKQVVNSLYGGHLEVTSENYEEISLLANKLQLSEVLGVVEKYMHQRLDGQETRTQDNVYATSLQERDPADGQGGSPYNPSVVEVLNNTSMTAQQLDVQESLSGSPNDTCSRISTLGSITSAVLQSQENAVTISSNQMPEAGDQTTPSPVYQWQVVEVKQEPKDNTEMLYPTKISNCSDGESNITVEQEANQQRQNPPSTTAQDASLVSSPKHFDQTCKEDLLKDENMNQPEDLMGGGDASRNTLRCTAWAVKALTDWLKKKNQPVEFEKLETSLLSALLSRFCREVRTKEGHFYSKSAMLNIRDGINRHLQLYHGAGWHKNINWDIRAATTNKLSVNQHKGNEEKLKVKLPFQSNMEDKSTITLTYQVKPEDKNKVKLPYQSNGVIISPGDLQQLYYKTAAFSIDCPLGLLRKVLFEICLHFRLTSSPMLRALKRDSFVFTTDQKGRQCVCLAKGELERGQEIAKERNRKKRAGSKPYVPVSTIKDNKDDEKQQSHNKEKQKNSTETQDNADEADESAEIEWSIFNPLEIDTSKHSSELNHEPSPHNKENLVGITSPGAINATASIRNFEDDGLKSGVTTDVNSSGVSVECDSLIVTDPVEEQEFQDRMIRQQQDRTSTPIKCVTECNRGTAGSPSQSQDVKSLHDTDVSIGKSPLLAVVGKSANLFRMYFTDAENQSYGAARCCPVEDIPKIISREEGYSEDQKDIADLSEPSTQAEIGLRHEQNVVKSDKPMKASGSDTERCEEMPVEMVTDEKDLHNNPNLFVKTKVITESDTNTNMNDVNGVTDNVSESRTAMEVCSDGKGVNNRDLCPQENVAQSVSNGIPQFNEKQWDGKRKISEVDDTKVKGDDPEQTLRVDSANKGSFKKVCFESNVIGPHSATGLRETTPLLEIDLNKVGNTNQNPDCTVMLATPLNKEMSKSKIIKMVCNRNTAYSILNRGRIQKEDSNTETDSIKAAPNTDTSSVLDQKQYYRVLTSDDGNEKSSVPLLTSRDHTYNVAESPEADWSAGVMYAQPWNPFCPVKSLKLYLSKSHPDQEAFFQNHNPAWSKKPEKSSWYCNRPLGRNSCCLLMQRLTEDANLATRYSLRNIRATGQELRMQCHKGKCLNCKIRPRSCMAPCICIICKQC